MGSFATSFDVADVWRPLSDAEQSVADTLASYASTLLRGRFADLDDRIADGSLNSDLAQLAVVQMVIRVLRNADFVRSESIDDYSVTYATETLSGELEITGAEAALLAPTPTRAAAGSFRVTPGLW